MSKTNLSSNQTTLIHEISTALYGKHKDTIGPSGLPQLRIFAESIVVDLTKSGAITPVLRNAIVEAIDQSPAFKEFTRAQDKGKWVDERGMSDTQQGKSAARKEKLMTGADKVSTWEVEKAAIVIKAKDLVPQKEKAFAEQNKKQNKIKELASVLADHYKVRMGKQDVALDTYGVSVYEKALDGLPPKAVEMMSDPTKKEESRIIKGAIQKRVQECFGMKTKDGKVVLDPVKLRDPNNVKLFNNLVKTDLGERNFDDFLLENQARTHVVNYSKSVMEAQGLKVDDKTKQKLANLADRMSQEFGPDYVEQNFDKVAFGIKQAVEGVKPNSKLSDKDLDKLLKKAEVNIKDSLTQQEALEDRGLRRPAMDAAPKISSEEAAKNKAKQAEADRALTNSSLELAADVAGRFNIKGKNLTMTKELYNIARNLTERLGPDYVKEHSGEIAIALEKEISKKQSIFSGKTVKIPEKNDFADKVYSQHRAASARSQEQAALQKAKPKNFTTLEDEQRRQQNLKDLGITEKDLPASALPKKVNEQALQEHLKGKSDLLKGANLDRSGTPLPELPKAAPFTGLKPPPLLSSIGEAMVKPLEKAPDTGLDTTPKPTMSYDDLVTTKPKTQQEAVQKLAQDIESQFMFGKHDVSEKTKGQFQKLAEGVVKDLGANYAADKSLAIAEEVAKKVKDVRKVSDSQVKDMTKGVIAKHHDKAQAQEVLDTFKSKAKEVLATYTPEQRAEIAARAKAKFEAEKIGSGVKKGSVSKAPASTNKSTPTVKKQSSNLGL